MDGPRTPWLRSTPTPPSGSSSPTAAPPLSPPPRASTAHWHATLTRIASFLDSCSFLWQHHAVDFFVHDYFNTGTFPASWRRPLLALADDDLLLLAAWAATAPPDAPLPPPLSARAEDPAAPWPQSLFDFLHDARAVPLPRSPQPRPQAPDSATNGSSTSISVAAAAGQQLRLDRHQVQGMNPKKQVEVRELADLVARIAASVGVTRILDLGAGQGYLDSVLCYQHGLTVVGVDDDEVQTCGARRRSDRLLREYARGEAKHGEAPQSHRSGRLLHVNRRVSAADAFDDLVAAADPDALGDGDGNKLGGSSQGWLLCGLHTCGDLAVATIQHFLESDARALVLVGCCYNRLTEVGDGGPRPVWATPAPDAAMPEPTSNASDSPTEPRFGYPLSKWLRARDPPVRLGFTARTLACQATSRWSPAAPSKSTAATAVKGDATPRRPTSVFARHHYRALLQLLLVQRGLVSHARAFSARASPEQDVIVGRLPAAASAAGFVEYARAALPRLGVDCVPDSEGGGPGVGTKGSGGRAIVPESALAELEAAYAPREREVAAVWTLRAIAGAAIESLILADRAAHVAEHGFDVELFPLFDQAISPRNMVLVVTR